MGWLGTIIWQQEEEIRLLQDIKRNTVALQVSNTRLRQQLEALSSSAAQQNDLLQLTGVVRTLQDVVNTLASTLNQQQEALTTQTLLLNQILDKLTVPTPQSLKVTMYVLNSQGELMSKAVKAGVDFVVQDDGTVKFALTPLDKLGNPTTLPAGTPPVSATSSDPALSLAVDPSDTSGFNLMWIGTPTALATGVVATFSTTLADSTVVSGSGDPVDIVAGGPAGFKVVES